MLAFEPFPRSADRLPTHWRLSLWVLRPRALAALLRWSGTVLSGSERAALKALQAPGPSATPKRARQAAAQRRAPVNRKAAALPWMARPPELAWRTATGLGLLILIAMVLTPTSNWQQCLLGGTLLLAAGLCARAPQGADDRPRVLVLMGISLLLAGRYAWWRVTQMGPFRASSWGSVYETVLAWYIMRPTLVALIAPRLGRFNVTAKGGRIEREFFDWPIATPYVVLIVANLTALLCGVASLMETLRPESAALALNMLWAVFNLLLLGVAVRVATESRQVRSAPRIRLTHQLPARLKFHGAAPLHVRLIDFSLEGVGLETLAVLPCQRDQACEVHLHDGRAWHAFPATISRVHGTSLGAQIGPLDIAGQRQLMACTFSRPDLWRRQSSLRHHDHPGWELWQLLRTGVSGYRHMLRLALRSAKHRFVAQCGPEGAR